MPSIIDTYNESNQSAGTEIYGANIQASGNSFTNTNATVLDSARFYLKKLGTPSGDMVARVYAHTGTFGTNSEPTGAILATSDAINASTLTTSYVLTTFTFTGVNNISLTAATKYCVLFGFSDGDISNHPITAGDDSSPTHPGNNFYTLDSSSSWITAAGWDDIFYVFAADATTTSTTTTTSTSTTTSSSTSTTTTSTSTTTSSSTSSSTTTSLATSLRPVFELVDNKKGPTFELVP